MTIKVMDEVEVGSDILMGMTKVNVDDLKDQHNHDDTLQLYYNGKNTGGVLKVKMQWIYSKKKYLQSAIEVQELTLSEERRQREELQQELKNMKKPFGYIQAYYQQEKVIEEELPED